MAAETLTTVTKALRTFHGPKMAKAIPEKVFLLKTIQDSSKYVQFGGRAATMYFPVHTQRNWGEGALSTEGGDFGTPRAHSFDEYSVTLAEPNWNMEVTGKLIDATNSRPDLSYIGKALEFEMSQLMKTAEKSLALKIFNDGSNALAQVDTSQGAITATQFYVDNPGIHWLEPGMNVDAWDAANKSSGGSNQLSSGTDEISAIDFANNRVTISDTTGLADGDYIKLTGTHGVTGIMGLLGHVDDGTNVSTYQGLARSGKPYTQAHVITDTNPLTEQTVFGVLRRLQKHSINEQIDHIVTDPQSCEWLALSLLDRQRFNGTTLVGGFAAVEFETPFGKKTIVPDALAWPGKMYFLRLADFGWGWMGRKGGDWANKDGKTLKQKVSSTSGTGYADAYVATWLMRCQLICHNPLNQAVLQSYVSP